MLSRDKDLLVRFGKHFQKLRIEKGFTQETLSYDSEVSLTQIARIETGKINPTFCTLHNLAKGLGISMNDVFKDF